MIYIKKFKVIQNSHLGIDIQSDITAKTDVHVSIGENVNHDSVLATVYRSDLSLHFDLFKELELKENANLDHYIDVSHGQIVQKGKLLAHKSSFGVENIIKAPFDGIVEIQKDRGALFIRSTPVAAEIRAYAEGKVTKIEKNVLYIQTNIIEVFPAFSLGKSIFAPLKVLKSLDLLNEEYKGCCIGFLGLVNKEFINRARAVNAVGIIGESCTHDIFHESHDAFTIASLGGFGMSHLEGYDKIYQSDGQATYIDTVKNEIILATKLDIADLKDTYFKEPGVGDSVVVYDYDAYGHIGKIKAVGDTIRIQIAESEKEYKKINIIGIID